MCVIWRGGGLVDSAEAGGPAGGEAVGLEHGAADLSRKRTNTRARAHTHTHTHTHHEHHNMNIVRPACRADARAGTRVNAQTRKRANAQTRKRANAQVLCMRTRCGPPHARDERGGPQGVEGVLGGRAEGDRGSVRGEESV